MGGLFYLVDLVRIEADEGELDLGTASLSCGALSLGCDSVSVGGDVASLTCGSLSLEPRCFIGMRRRFGRIRHPFSPPKG